VASDINRLKQLTQLATGLTPWRGDNIFHKKNEVYIDVTESVNVLMSVKGNILRADVSGKVDVRALLSGLPECKFGMNDKLLMNKEQKKPGANDKGITIDDIKFHQCVKLPKFDKERAISFVPPDGPFELMTYRITENINLPFKITPMITENGKRIEYRV